MTRRFPVADVKTLTPVEVAEQPWPDPFERFLSGVYRFRVPGQPLDDGDHLVLYIRGSGGDPNVEYAADTTICGQDLHGATKPRSLTTACPACRDGVGQAFERARAHLADRGPGILE